MKKVMIVIGLLCVLFIMSPFFEREWDKNATLLRENILSIKEGTETVFLLDVTPFQWDIVYSFDPYTSKESIYETVGYKWATISETVSEGMNQLVFLKEGKVVCYVYGYPVNLGYGISFTGEKAEKTASVLQKTDHLYFQVNKTENIVYLSND